MKRPVQCAEQQETPYIVPATKLWVEDCQKSINCFCQYKDDSSLIRAPTRHLAPVRKASLPHLDNAFCVEETDFAFQLPPKISPNASPHGKWRSNITKHCPCHRKWHGSLILVMHETSSTMRGATRDTLGHHQTLHLPRNCDWKIWPKIASVIPQRWDQFNQNQNQHFSKIFLRAIVSQNNSSESRGSWQLNQSAKKRPRKSMRRGRWFDKLGM